MNSSRVKFILYGCSKCHVAAVKQNTSYGAVPHASHDFPLLESGSIDVRCPDVCIDETDRTG